MRSPFFSIMFDAFLAASWVEISPSQERKIQFSCLIPTSFKINKINTFSKQKQQVYGTFNRRLSEFWFAPNFGLIAVYGTFLKAIWHPILV